jgi:hypothetical protein
MGYELHITRGENWFDDEPQITCEEWLAIVDADPDLRLDGFAEAELGDGSVLRAEDPTIAVWTAHPDAGMETLWISYSQGNIVVKGPDEPTRRKMWQIAQLLNARVQGDDGEFYGPDGEELSS